MTPQQAISDLDQMLQSYGQDVFLRDMKVPVTDPANTPGKKLRAFVRGYKPDELAGGIQQGQSAAVISPSSLEETGVDALKRYGRITVSGRLRSIQVADPVEIDGVVVRWNLWIV